jgi:hypothetical protein
MKHVFFALAAATLLMTSTGCGICDQMFCRKPGGGCNGCDSGGCGGCGDGACANGGGCANCGNANGGYADGGGCANSGGGQGCLANGCVPHGPLPRGAGGTYVGPEGPPTGAVAYPYYTTRGPRDFLINNPPSIGP